MNKVEVLENTYEIIRNDNNCFDKTVLLEKMTDYFIPFDYICGDYAYEKLRLKGFYETGSKKARRINDIKYFEKYLKEYCAYGSSVFLLKKVK